MRRCRSTSSSSKDTVDEDPRFVSKMHCRYNVKSVSTVFHLLTPLQASCPWKKPHCDLLLPKRGPTTLVGFLSSSFTRLQSVYLLSRFQHPLDLENHTTSAFSSSRQLFCTLTTPSYAHCLIYGCHFMLSSYLT